MLDGALRRHPCDRPPLGTLEQPAPLRTGLDGFRKRVDVYARTGVGMASPFGPTLARLRDDPAWTVHELDAAHNLVRDAPDDLREILLDVAR